MDFEQKLSEKLKQNKNFLSQEKIYKFKIYYKLLLEYNEKFNLTAITDEDEVISKHFVDSLTALPYIKGKKVIDIGTGAGFPGIPLKIVEDFEMVLVDSVGKKVDFVNMVISQLGLKNIKAIHSRIEDLANLSEYRENFDACISRAVAPLSVLTEYSIPFCKIGGSFLAFKGSNAKNEVKEAKFAIEKLGAQVLEIHDVSFGGFDRNIVEIKKILKTQKEFPRTKNLPRKDPLKNQL